MTIQELRNSVEQMKGKRDQVVQSIDATNQKIKDHKRDLKRHEEAREIIRAVGLRTQEMLSYHISDITSLALSSVYDDPYEVKVEFVARRNRTECDINFVRNGESINPMDASGGGAVNVASLALRIASWSMQRPRSRNTIILDEPLANLSMDLMPKASEMLHQLSQRLGLQLIIVTHSEDLISAADKIFRVTIHKGISHVEEE